VSVPPHVQFTVLTPPRTQKSIYLELQMGQTRVAPGGLTVGWGLGLLTSSGLQHGPSQPPCGCGRRSWRQEGGSSSTPTPGGPGFNSASPSHKALAPAREGSEQRASMSPLLGSVMGRWWVAHGVDIWG
jgi:hypothetical protein